MTKVIRVIKIMDNFASGYLNFGLLIEADGCPKDTREMRNWTYFPIDELPEPMYIYARENVERLIEGSIQPRRA